MRGANRYSSHLTGVFGRRSLSAKMWRRTVLLLLLASSSQVCLATGEVRTDVGDVAADESGILLPGDLLWTTDCKSLTACAVTCMTDHNTATFTVSSKTTSMGKVHFHWSNFVAVLFIFLFAQLQSNENTEFTPYERRAQEGLETSVKRDDNIPWHKNAI